jgi:hypothetical protein
MGVFFSKIYEEKCMCGCLQKNDTYELPEFINVYSRQQIQM